MKQFFSVLFMFVFISGLALAQNTAQDIAPRSEGPAIINGDGGEPLYEGPSAILYDMSQLVNDPGGGLGGADRSFIEAALGHTLYGWGHQHTLNYIIADSFTVPAGESWQIDELTTFAYQTGAPTTSTITGVYAQIYDGDPMTTGTVIWGDLTTNIMTNTTWSNIYRTTETAPTASDRAIMVQTSAIGTTLSAGTYWIGWNTDGTLASGPWCPPRTILGVAVTGHAKQFTTSWVEALNGTQPNGAPFILSGSVVGGGNTFFENFDGFIAGQQVACQDPVNWTTWNTTPCDPVTDAYVSSNYSYSPSNSAVIVQDNDLVKPLGDKTAGQWFINMMVYVPSGKSGYFNTLAVFTPPSTFDWAMEVYFDIGGGGRVTNVPGAPVAFTYPVGSWFSVDLAIDFGMTPTHADLVINGTSVLSWDWTQAGTVTDQLAANDFFGATVNDEMYFDNYYFSDQPIPVELTSFSANTNNGLVVLNWATATEVNNQGFEVQRRTAETEYSSIGFVEGHGTTTETHNYSFTDRNAQPGVTYYRLKQVDYDGTFEYSPEVEVNIAAPLAFNLEQNYPNPFNPSTNIVYSIPENGNVRLSVYNVVGEEVAVLVNETKAAGNYTIEFNASNLPSGVYLYKLQAANSVQTRKMMLLK